MTDQVSCCLAETANEFKAESAITALLDEAHSASAAVSTDL